MAKGWLKRPKGRNCTLFVYLNAAKKPRSKTLGPASMTDEDAWKKVGAEGYDLLVAEPDPDHGTFGNMAQAYLAHGRTKAGRPKSHSTMNTEKRNVRIHLSHWSRRVAKDIKPAEVQDWINEQSDGLQAKLRNLMSAIYRFGQVREMIPRRPDANPMPWVSASEITDYEAVDVSPKEAFAILDQIKDALVRCLIVLVSATGLRVSEALGLRWSDVEWEKGKIQVRRGFVDGEIGGPKSKASRAPVEMHKTLAAVLVEWRKQTEFAQEGDFLFASKRMNGSQPRLGSMISTDYVRPAAIKAKVITEDCPRFGLHNLRHGLSTFLAESGTDPVVIQRMLRWSNVSMLQRYAHPAKKARKAQGVFLGRMLGKRVQGRVQKNGPPKRRPA